MKTALAISLSMMMLLQCENSAASKPPLPDSPIAANDQAAVKPSATPKSEKKMDKQKLAEKIKPIDETVSAIILDQTSKLEQISTPFLKSGGIYKVSKFAPTRPLQIYIGEVEPDYATIIAGDQEKYFDFIRRAGLIADNNETRIEYFKNYLEIMHAGKRLQIVSRVSEIQQRPNLDDSQKAKFAEFQQKFEKVISAPKRNDAGSYDVYAVKGQNLVKFTMALKEDKTIEIKETVLEENLLIPYAL